MRLVNASEIREMDRITIQETGIAGVVLMENAARSAAGLFVEHFGPETGARITILCGRGNNGGDGYVMARYLHNMGFNVIVIILCKAEGITGDARVNLEIIKKMNLEIIESENDEIWTQVSPLLNESDYIIDGILGTGLNSPVKDYYGRVLKDINESGRAVMAIDIASGVNADTGRIMGIAVKADITATFGFPKQGQLIYPGAEMTGRLVRIDIGIPNIVADRIPESCRLIEPGFFDYLLSEGRRDIHKGSRGHLLVLAGSTGKSGAAALTALGALRAGAGLVTAGIPEGLNHVLEVKLTEAMTVPLPETDEGTLSIRAADKIFDSMKGKSAVAIGPGLSTNPETIELVRLIVKECSIPMVIDADGLNALAGDEESLSSLNKNMVLTPHPGEMSRLSGIKTDDIQADRIGAARRFALARGCYLVLKGAGTIVADPGGMTCINPTGCPALAGGGSGDVLTGLTGGFLAKGWPVEKAVNAAVFLHGMAAEYIAESIGECGVLAGELPNAVPVIMKSLAKGRWPLKNPSLMKDLKYPV